jgi:META domain.
VNDTKTATGENTPFIIFDNQNLKFNGFTGCNRIFGDMAFDSKERNSIEFNQMGSTKMTCPDNQIETEIIKALDSVTSVENGNCPETEPQCIYLCSIDGKRVLLLQKRISQKVEKSLIEEQAVEEE